MIGQTFWLTGCDWAKERRWTERHVFCCFSFLSARGYRNCLKRRLLTAPHAPRVSPHPRRDRNALRIQLWKEEQNSSAEKPFHRKRSKQEYLASDLLCWANSSLFRQFSFSVRADMDFSHPVERLVKRSLRNCCKNVTVICHSRVTPCSACFNVCSFGHCMPKWTCFSQLVRSFCRCSSVFFDRKMPNTPTSPSKHVEGPPKYDLSLFISTILAGCYKQGAKCAASCIRSRL